jgi:hypothetical protein
MAATTVSIRHCSAGRAVSAGADQRPRRWWRRGPRDQKLGRLGAVPALAAWSRPELLALSRAADLVDARPGQELATGAHPAQWWWLVLSGELQLVVDGSPLSTLRSGQWLRPELPVVRHLKAVSLIAALPSAVLVGRMQDLEGADPVDHRMLEALNLLPGPSPGVPTRDASSGAA